MSRGVTWIRKRGDSAPVNAAQLRNPDGTPVDLSTAATIDVVFYREEQQSAVLTGNALIPNPTAGHVQFPTFPQLTATAGLYAIEFVVNWVDTTVQRFPADSNQDFLYMLVREDRASAAFPVAPVVDLPDIQDDFVIQIVRWTPLGVQVIEVQRLDENLNPVGSPFYLSGDPLAPWLGDPGTLLDSEP